VGKNKLPDSWVGVDVGVACQREKKMHTEFAQQFTPYLLFTLVYMLEQQ
jgi:hypothetical protein